MWRPRTLVLVVLLAAAAWVGIGFVGAQLTASPPAATPSPSCPFQGVATVSGIPADACSGYVPSYTIDICAEVTAGVTHCPITIGDPNPANWVEWLGCEFVNVFTTDLPNLASAIWASIVSYVGAFLVDILNSLTSAVVTPFDLLLNAISGSIVAGLQDLAGAIVTLFDILVAVCAAAGPFAPVLAVTLTLGVIAVAGILLFFLIIALIAGFKTAFNLL